MCIPDECSVSWTGDNLSWGSYQIVQPFLAALKVTAAGGSCCSHPGGRTIFKHNIANTALVRCAAVSSWLVTHDVNVEMLLNQAMPLVL